MMKLSPRNARRIHLAFMVFWAINMVGIWFVPASWRIPYLVAISIYAAFVGNWSGFSAERPTEIHDPTDEEVNKVDN